MWWSAEQIDQQVRHSSRSATAGSVDAARRAGSTQATTLTAKSSEGGNTATSPQEFATLASNYRYEKTALDARIEQTTDTPAWKREKITFNGANGARAIAYLYLPNHVPRPLQVMHYLPAADVDNGFRSLPESMDERMTPFVRAGRAAFAVVLEGYIERLRPANFVRPDVRSVEFADIIVRRVTDLRRGLDYLETRTDIDMTRVGIVAPSAGSTLAVILGALETRYRAIVLIGAGLPGATTKTHRFEPRPSRSSSSCSNRSS